MAFISPMPLVHSAARRRPRSRDVSTRTVTQAARHFCARMTAVPPTKADASAAGAGNVAAFFLELGVSREESDRIAKRAPALLDVSDLHSHARPVLEFLSDLGLSTRQTSRALQHAPTILLHDTSEFDTRLAFLRVVARFPSHKIAAAVARSPHLIWMDLSRARRVIALVRTACPTLSADTIGAILVRAPQALLGGPGRIQRNIEFLRDVAGVSDSTALGRVFTKIPLALVYDIEDNMAVRVKYFLDVVGLDVHAVGRLIAAVPEVLMWGMDTVIRPKMAEIASIVGVDGVKIVLEKVPVVVASNAALQRAAWLRDVVGLNEDQIAAVVREAPAVLTHSIDGNLAPKWAFVQGTMGGTVADIVRAPREILCANLQQRAVPRYAFLASKGMENVDVVDVLKGSDVEFCRNIAKCEPAVFRKYVDNDTYLLFFSQLL